MTPDHPAGSDIRLAIHMPTHTTVATDRTGLGGGLLGLLTAFSAASLGFATLTVPSSGRSAFIGFGAGALSGALAVLALRSLPVRWVSRVVVMLGALLLARYGQLGADGSMLAAPGLIGWAVTTAVGLVLATRAEHHADRGSALSRAKGSGAPMARDALAVAALVAAVTVALGPTAAMRFDSGSSPGDAADFSSYHPSSPLAGANQLDMADRPHLGDKMVMTVASDAPSFWRTQTFDRWDGENWTHSNTGLTLLGADGNVRPQSTDLAASAEQTIHQTIRLVAPYAVVLPAAPSPTHVTAGPAIRQGIDGELRPAEPFGAGASYSVTSHQPDVTGQQLRTTDDSQIPREIIDAYTTTPATDRVRAIAASITAGAGNNFDRVHRIIEWLGGHVSYSINSPLAPSGRDVVDDFLFESHEGWCEQIASSLVVLLRLNHVPARLAIGFVPGQRNAITQRYEVRERDAHAWTEVWFPTVGWVPFDPTANVPLSGDQVKQPTDWFSGTLATALLVAGAIVVLGEPAIRLLRGRRRAAPRRVPRERSQRWEATMELRLERLGGTVDHARRPSQTASDYAADLSRAWSDDRLERVGRLIDQSLYAPDEPDPDDREFVERTLQELHESTPPPEPAHADT